MMLTESTGRAAVQALTAAACVVLLATVGPGRLTAQTPLTADALHPGGTRLSSEAAGVSFTVPEGYRGGWDGDLQGVLVAAPGGPLLAAVWGWSQGTLEEAEGVVGQRLEAAGIRGQLREAPEGEDGREARAWYDVVTSDGRGLLRAVLRRGDAGNVVAVAALGSADGEAAVSDLADRILASLELAVPGAAAWRAEVEGTALSTSSSSSDYSPGGAGGGGSAASESRSTLQLCRTGYAYETSSESYISIEGASASRTSGDAHQGAWWLVADLLGNATLVLEAQDGRAFYWPVEERGEDIIVDGVAYGTSGGC